MSNSDYIKVKEFAALVKKTYQSVYKQIENGYLLPYVKEEDGVIYISTEATKIYPKRRRKGTMRADLVETMGDAQGEQTEKVSDLGEKVSDPPREQTEKVSELTEKVSDLGEPLSEQTEKVSEQGEQEKPTELEQCRLRIEQLERELGEARETIKEKDKKIVEMADRAFTLAERLTQLTENGQVLQAREQERKGLFSGLKRLFLPSKSAD